MRRGTILALGFVAGAMLWLSAQGPIQGVLGATGSDVQNGDDYYSITGDWSYSGRYSNGIVLSPGSGSAEARWLFAVNYPPPQTYALTVGVYFAETSAFGGGSDLYMWNSGTASWDELLNMGRVTDVSKYINVEASKYLDEDGFAYVDIYADGLDSTHIAWVSLAWIYDGEPPSNPNSYVANPPIRTWTDDNSIEVTWSGASDAHAQIGGYSIQWSHENDMTPDSSVDTVLTSTTSSALPDGEWYLNVRAVDSFGNWAPTAFHMGPFWIDTVGPSEPILVSPPTGVLNDNTPTISWGIPSDLSGVAGYSYSVDAPPDDTIDTTSTSVNLPQLTDGQHVFYVKATDSVGNWGTPTSVILTVDTNPLSPEGPFGPWLIVLIVAVVIGVILTVIVIAVELSGKPKKG